MSRPGAEPAQIETLTAFRFFAAAWVVLYHWWPKLDVGFTPNLALKGYLGVEAFFVLSGFVISHVYLAAYEEGRFRYGGFLWARLARIYPLHLATLGGVALLAIGAGAMGASAGANVLDLASLPANLLMVHAWGLSPEAAFNHPSWSISAEWFAYLAFPAFAAVALRFRSPLQALLAALLLLFVSYILFEALTGRPLTQATIHWGALRIVPCFALGCALYLVFRTGALKSREVAWGGALMSLGAIVLLADVGAHDAFLTASFGALILSLAGLWSTGAIRRAPLFGWLGEISYSTYMICIPWQLLFVNGAAKALGLPEERLPLWLWLAGVLALIPLSAASYLLIERPARSLLKRRAPRALANRQGATLQPAT
jgi:peptidoglycan/LPS O-acetylase OafA/YrhL